MRGAKPPGRPPLLGELSLGVGFSAGRLTSKSSGPRGTGQRTVLGPTLWRERSPPAAARKDWCQRGLLPRATDNVLTLVASGVDRHRKYSNATLTRAASQDLRCRLLLVVAALFASVVAASTVWPLPMDRPEVGGCDGLRER